MIGFLTQQGRFKVILVVVLLLIFAASILYTHYLSRQLAAEERRKVELLATAFKHLNEADPDTDISFLFHVIESNKTVPLIVTDSAGHILLHKNLDEARIARDSAYLLRQLQHMKANYEPVPIEYTRGNFQYVYYRETPLLTQLRFFPYIQFFFILLFLLVAYLTFNTVRRAEQNRVWAGMAKETAHQLGTPISALAGWVDYLKLQAREPAVIQMLPEMEKDIQRLELIAERFSKIGSLPDLSEHDIVPFIRRTAEYVRRRSSDKVQLLIHEPAGGSAHALIVPQLFEWVIENLLKNALDAINGQGHIAIHILPANGYLHVDVQDDGKGIPASQFKAVFKPGFSTKKRGWGLGLSLAKRIIEDFHNGKIMVKESAPGKGTTFRITLKSRPA
ncbi:MAG: HAMP domain-containing sensor histidine kinase [Chitinophagales bacterium]|nr:HAMP domain-containing histidine kinase [Chitinophagales bacterium]MDW8393771.1 HAMP domain-containing sensor histidine kinase [Chitinophagales bacterium]